MKNILLLIYGIVTVALCVGTTIKGLRADYLLTTIVGAICTVVALITLISGIYTYFKDRGRHKK